MEEKEIPLKALSTLLALFIFIFVLFRMLRDTVLEKEFSTALQMTL